MEKLANLSEIRTAFGFRVCFRQPISKMLLKPISLSRSKCDPRNIIYNGCLSRMSVRGGCASSHSANLASIPIFEMACNFRVDFVFILQTSFRNQGGYCRPAYPESAKDSSDKLLLDNTYAVLHIEIAKT